MLPLIKEGKEAKRGEPAGSPAAVRLSNAPARCPQSWPPWSGQPSAAPVPAPAGAHRRPPPWELNQSPCQVRRNLKGSVVWPLWGTGSCGAGPQTVCKMQCVWGRRLICSPEGGARRAALPSGCDREQCQFGGLGGRWR